MITSPTPRNAAHSSMNHENQENPRCPDQRDTPVARQRILTSDDILAGEKEVLITHHGEIYRLRETRNGKLILGK